MSYPERGANCQTTTGGILDRLGYVIPNPRSLELALDRAHTKVVHRIAGLRSHDVIIYLPRDGRTDIRYGHTTIAHVEGGTLYLAHNSARNGRAITEAARLEDQGRIAIILRPAVRHGNGPDIPWLTAYGFEHLATAV